MSEVASGGCQCGAVRFRASKFGRASICHCRMCQKAFGGFFGALVTAHDLEWTRGEPKRFASSNKVQRGFCAACGTPLTYEYGGPVEVAVGAEAVVEHVLGDAVPVIDPRKYDFALAGSKHRWGDYLPGDHSDYCCCSVVVPLTLQRWLVLSGQSP